MSLFSKIILGPIIPTILTTIPTTTTMPRPILSAFPQKEKSRKIKYGDIIGVKRYHLGINVYDHFGIYIGDKKVIHFADVDGDFGNNIIHETTLDLFLDGNPAPYTFDLPSSFSMFEPKKVPLDISSSSSCTGCACAMPGTDPLQAFLWLLKAGYSLAYIKERLTYHRYTPDEIVERAKSKLGEKEYSLLNKNCEHFAFWAATDVEMSYQVDNMLLRLNRIPVPISVKI